ncbi:S8 family serine peptidase [Angustibacter sp. McL0619]|uniref:S8 family serine peptidase n=1 Tax=Angustibacter sp. McL0619 TaxID=3415676 RepID=UPI003CF921DA
MNRRPGAIGAPLAAIVAASVVAAGLAASPAAAATAGPTTRHKRLLDHRGSTELPASAKTAGSVALGTTTGGRPKVDGALTGVKGSVAVMVELDAAPAASAFAASRPRGSLAAASAARSQTGEVRTQQKSVESHFGSTATKARVIYRTHALYSGLAVTTDASRLDALAKLPGVKAIHKLTPKSIDNSASVPLIGAPAAWAGRDDTGQDVRVGIIDTGIDYTHADFGGPGTVQAFADAGASSTFTPTAKVAGGYDFAGDLYDPADPAHATAVPDHNPLDCNGHGSHVAGTTAGLGVSADGSTYSGSYSHDLDPAGFRIGPGVAPGAALYALKVFGCEGATDLVSQALDWAADPDGNGDLSDRLDVVNLSLGSDYGSPDDPDAVAANKLAELGTVVVASMGNSGDVYEIGGSPANATRVIAVAASDDGSTVADGLRVTTPSGIEPADTVDGSQDDTFAALRSDAYAWATKPGVTDADVVRIGDWTTDPSNGNNTDGCAPFNAADAAKVVGKVVLLSWGPDGDRRCGSGQRGEYAAAAGALGAVYGGQVDSFSAGITGVSDIPVMLTIKQATDAINARLEAAVPVHVTMTDALHNTNAIKSSGAVDQLASFSSRGIGTSTVVKPDVSAPGVTTFSAAVGTGNDGVSDSGTSMASPHVAGEAALVRSAHKTWTTEEVKAAIMNTATQDVTVGPDHSGQVYGPERVGAGRVKADAAVDTNTLAYVKDTPGAVGVSFGPLAVTADSTLTKTIHVVNKRPVSVASYSIVYQPAHPTPGVTYSVSPSQIALPAGGSVDVTVTLKVVRSQLQHTADPTTDPNPYGLQYADGSAGQRSYRTDASGRVVLSPVGATSGSALRVPVWSAPRPASTMKAAAALTVTGSGAIQGGALTLSGASVDQGSGNEAYVSTVSAFQLQGSSAQLPACSTTLVMGCIAKADDRSADLRYVGSASDGPVFRSAGANPLVDDPSLPLAQLSFGLNTYGPWRTPASYTEFVVFLDANADGTPDAATYNTRLADPTGDFDYFVAQTVDLRPGHQGQLLDLELINLTDGSFETGLFNSDSLTMSVSLANLSAAGLINNANHNLRYWVSSYAENDAVDVVGSAAAPLSVNWYSPALSATGDGYSAIGITDSSDVVLDVRRDEGSLSTDKPAGLLLLHHLNANGSRAQVVPIRTGTTVKLTSNSTSYTYGGHPVYTATVTSSKATGSVSFKDGTKVLKTLAVSGGKATYTASGQARGTHSMTAVFSGTGDYLSSTSAAVKVTVNGLTSTTKVAANDRDFGYGYRPTLTATVTSAATGTVTFRDGSKVLGTATVSKGKAVLKAPVLARGTRSIKATYNGSSVYNPSTSSAMSIRVR